MHMDQPHLIYNMYMQPCPQSRAFSYLLSTNSLPFYLTILNNRFATCSFSVVYNGAILRLVKPRFSPLNSFTVYLTRINQLTNYPINQSPETINCKQ